MAVQCTREQARHCSRRQKGGPQRREAPQPAQTTTKLAGEIPRPSPQSQSFSRSYGSILPTSLIYILPLTRGCSPWRPEAVMSTTRGADKTLTWIFKDRRDRTGQRKKYAALPANQPYRRVNRFQGAVGKTVKKKRELFPGASLVSPSSFVLPHVTTSWPRNINLVPFR